MAEASGKIFWFNSHWYDYADVHGGETVQPEWQAIVDPAVGGKARRQWAQSLKAGTALEIELPLRGKDGQYRPFLTRAIPLCDGKIIVDRWIGTHIDISEQKRREEHIRFIIDELSHRTKNLLAVVMAIANQTARHADDVAQYRARFAERLTALAHCHDLLVRDSWQGASFSDLVSAQLKPFRESKGGRISVSSSNHPAMPCGAERLGWRRVSWLMIALESMRRAVHPAWQGINSMAFKRDGYRVCMHWRERDGTARGVLLHRRGFGYVVIEQIVPGALNGNSTLDFSATGVNWTFEFPATSCF